MNTKYQLIKTATSAKELSGIGLEILLDQVDGTLLAKFWNGNMVCDSSLDHLGNVLKDEDTLVIAA